MRTADAHNFPGFETRVCYEGNRTMKTGETTIQAKH